MEIMVEFILFSEKFPIDEVYEKIGIVEGKKEDREEAQFETLSGGVYIREKECSVTYFTGYIETIDVEEPVKKIYDMLLPHEKEIAECIEKYRLNAKFCVVINLSDNPIIGLSKEFINLASKFHAEIEFDSYIDYDDVGRPFRG